MAPFSNDRLNFFKFCKAVLDEFPLALRQVFTFLWNNSEERSHPKWDDTDEVRNIFLKEEDWGKNVPTSYSFKEWNCAVLFQATLYAKKFGEIDGNGGRRTLKQLYVKRELSKDAFHPGIGRRFRKQPETFALALDQLRLLRNALCYHNKEQEVDDERLDSYLKRAKEAFAALHQDNTRLDNVEKLKIHCFSTEECKRLASKLTQETEAAIKFNQMEDLSAGDEKPRKRDVVADLQDVKVSSNNTKAKKEEKSFVEKEVQTANPEKVTVGKSGNNEVADLNITMDHSEPERRDNKMEMSNVQTRNDAKNSCPEVKTLLPEKKEKWDDVAPQDTKERVMTTNVEGFVPRFQSDWSDVGNVKRGTVDTRNACPVGFKNAYPPVPSDALAEVDNVELKTQEESDKKKKMETTETSCVKRDVKSMAKYFEENLNNQTQDANGKASSPGGKKPEKGANGFKTRTGSDSNHGGIGVTKRQKSFEPDVSNVSSGVSSVKTKVEDVDPKLKDLKTERNGLLPPDDTKTGKTVNPTVASDNQNQHTSQEELKGGLSADK